ncbi:MAG: hypothetical protein HGA37_01530 [Lentimicrobium sp.]|nr:hypothetical protein [Lentimicrobium sp.]
MKPIIISLLLALVLVSCNNSTNEVPYQAGIYQGEVKEVLQTSKYTYLLVKEEDNEKWLALPKMEARKGDIYFYNDGYEMNNFKSKELDRTFESVFFIDRIGKTAAEVNEGQVLSGNEPVKAEVRRYELEIPQAENGIRIASLFANKLDFKGKRVIIKGKVTHYNTSIMKKNWIHLQDGTEFTGKYDLTATSDTLTVKVGQVITIEGTVELDQDFGYGYYYEILLSDIKILEE